MCVSWLDEQLKVCLVQIELHAKRQTEGNQRIARSTPLKQRHRLLLDKTNLLHSSLK